MILSSLGEVTSLATVFPFLSVLTNKNIINENLIFKSILNDFQFINAENFPYLITILFGLTAILSASIRLLNIWLNVRLAAAIGTDLSCKAYYNTLNQPYEKHLQNNSSSIITTTITHTKETVVALNLFLQLLTAFIVSIGILIALFLIDWQIALFSLVIFAIAYLLISFKTKNRLFENSVNVAEANREQIKLLQEGLGSIRDVILDNNQVTFVSEYRRADIRMRVFRARSQFIQAFPRFGLEALGLVLIAFLALLLTIQKGTSFELIPILGVIALGSQRLLPSFQQIYASWAGIKACESDISKLLIILNQKTYNNGSYNSKNKLFFNKTIELKNIRFNYINNKNLVLKDINLKINKGEKIALIGITGSGKSTFVDILMGLLKPINGKILIDGKELYNIKNPNFIYQWRSIIAHVPQSIYLSDSSILENIAFGVNKKDIDINLARTAAQKAQILDFIDNSEKGFNTFVGERGIQLSGGQRQRVGIARALYKKAKILILDEATSALDNKTEIKVIKSIEKFNPELTIIMIAHRISSIKGCDRIFEIEEGIIKKEIKPKDI